MKLTRIDSANLISYNANNRGSNTSDCVNRALSLAFDIDYVQINKELNAAKKEARSDSWKRPFVYEKVITAHGGSKRLDVKREFPDDYPITLEEFVDNCLDSNKSYLIETGSKPNQTTHIVAVVDGQVFDSWDSRTQYAVHFYKIGHVDRKPFTEINLKDHVAECKDAAIAEADKLIQKQDWPNGSACEFYRATTTQYQCKVSACVNILPCEYSDKGRKYTFDFTYVATPSTTNEELAEIIKKTAKTRVYDRFYAINQEEKKLKEEYETHISLGHVKNEKGMWIKPDSKYLDIEDTYMDTQERKFYKSLPGWARGLVNRVEIQNPGSYNDSYRVKISKLPNDTRGCDTDYRGDIVLEAYDASQMKDMLKRYHDKLELPYRDYDPYEEY